MRIPLLAVLVLVTLTACTPAVTTADPTPAPTATPAFASDEEALAAAKLAYGKYLAAIDAIFSRGGADLDGLADVTSDEWFKGSAEDVAEFREKGYRTVGLTTFSKTTLQQYSQADSEVTVYLCEDVSAVDVFDATGASVVAPTRRDRSLMQATFQLKRTTLVVSNVELWSDQEC